MRDRGCSVIRVARAGAGKQPNYDASGWHSRPLPAAAYEVHGCTIGIGSPTSVGKIAGTDDTRQFAIARHQLDLNESVNTSGQREIGPPFPWQPNPKRCHSQRHNVTLRTLPPCGTPLSWNEKRTAAMW